MALTSVGYDGSVDELEWALLTSSVGAEYAVRGAGDWRVTTVSGLDRTVSIAAGSGYGHGVLDTTDAAEQVQLSTVASGSRWDTIVARRNWSTNTTTLIAVQGTSSQGVSASRLTGPGVQDDQPIALVQVTAGQQLPTGIVDLRCWHGNGGLVAASQDALGYLTAPGTVAWIAGVPWVRNVTTGGVAEWVRADGVGVVGSQVTGTYGGQQVRRHVRAASWVSNHNGDVIAFSPSSYAGILFAQVMNVDPIQRPLTFHYRVTGDGLVIRVWSGTTVMTNFRFTAVLDVWYW